MSVVVRSTTFSVTAPAAASTDRLLILTVLSLEGIDAKIAENESITATQTTENHFSGKTLTAKASGVVSVLKLLSGSQCPHETSWMEAADQSVLTLVRQRESGMC